LPYTAQGGAGRDFIIGGNGKDTIDAGPGADFVQVAADNFGDTIVCGSGDDTVRADPLDTVAADCEHVTIVGA
jgi:Ca2+-binding RTX toxin-like protein